MIRHTVRVGQLWQSNDTRRLAVVRVISILGYATGQKITESILTEQDNSWSAYDLVRVENVMTKRRSSIRRDQFTTGVRGWSLSKEAPNAAA